MQFLLEANPTKPTQTKYIADVVYASVPSPPELRVGLLRFEVSATRELSTHDIIYSTTSDTKSYRPWAHKAFVASRFLNVYSLSQRDVERETRFMELVPRREDIEWG